MSAKAAFLKQKPPDADRKPVAAVREALVERDGKAAVFRVRRQDGEADRRQQGRDLGDSVEVNGVKSGDRVVLKPADKLRDGAAAVQAAKK